MRFLKRHAFGWRAAVLLAAANLFPFDAGAQVGIRVGGGGRAFPGLVFSHDTSEEDETPVEPPDPAGTQAIEFADGATLHGCLESLDVRSGEVLWRRDDAASPIAIPSGQITRLNLSEAATGNTPAHATVKLSGGNWITADVLGMQGGKLQLRMGDGALLTVDRAHLEWIFFSKSAAPECYDGPTSMAGWVSAGGWMYRDGALRASTPALIGRMFELLPDRVEYVVEVDQDPRVGDAFAILLHGSNPIAPPQGPSFIQLMFLGNTLQMAAQIEGSMRVQQTELQADKEGGRGEVFLKDAEKPKNKVVRIRVFEDRLAGRMVIYVNGSKIADWPVGKCKAGENKGCFSFQPLGWTSDVEHSVSRLRVLPWSGRLPDSKQKEQDGDSVTLAGGEMKSGRIEAITADHVKLHTSSGTTEVPREKLAMLRFAAPENPEDEDPPLGYVRLAHRGEFEVTDLSCQNGKFTVQTAFAGQITLPAKSVREVQFAHHGQGETATAADEIVFRNGDRLRGHLVEADGSRKIHWRAVSGNQMTEIDTARIAGISMGANAAAGAEEKNGAAVRFRNEDILTGQGVKLEKDQLILTTSAAGELTIPRKTVETLYLSPDGKPTIFDAALHPEACIGNHVNVDAYVNVRRNRGGPPKLPNPWRAFDGVFSLPSGVPRAATLTVADAFDSMPEVAELSFHVTCRKPPVIFSAQIFSADDNAGYLFQLQGDGIFVYDMAPRRRMGGVQQQQIQFSGKVKEDVRERDIRLLVDRPAGKLVIMMDGVMMGQFHSKGPTGPRDLGRNIVLMTQAGAPCTFSRIWIGPWDGQAPDSPATTEKAGDVVMLANGDETPGTVQSIDDEMVRIDSDIGAMEIPSKRTRMIRMRAAEGKPSIHGARLRLANTGVITVSTYRIENGEITCRSDLAGDLKIPLSSLRELVFIASEGEKARGPVTGKGPE